MNSYEENLYKMNYRRARPVVSAPFCFGIFFVVTEMGCRWIGNFF
jgi:hypothetical protein